MLSSADLNDAAGLNDPTQPLTNLNLEENQYLNLVRHILDHGEYRQDRTGTGTKSIFAPPQLSFSLANQTLPLLTTKRVALKAVFEELMWFINGKTDAKLLSDKGVKIWDANGSKAFLERVGLGHRREGDLGPVYGFQWRHFGAEYVDADTDYTGKGVDQLRAVIHKIKHEPFDRRIILSAWNPAALKDMALPPCHMFCQFYVSQDTEEGPATLSCQLYQRSCDMGLGVPFNIASYSILTILLAHVCGLMPGKFTHCMGDTHVYMDHVEPLQIQLQRTPRPFPRLVILPEQDSSVESMNKRKQWTVDEALKELESFTFDRLNVIDYQPYGKIPMKMSA